MTLIKSKNDTMGFKRALVAGSCSLGLLLGATAVYAGQYGEAEKQDITTEQSLPAGQNNAQPQEGMASDQGAESGQASPTRQDSMSNAQTTPENESMSNAQATPESDSMSNAQATPQNDSMSNAQSTPEGDSMSNAQATPEQEPMPNAQEGISSAESQQQQMATELPSVDHTAKGLIGMTVKNANGNDIGEVSDIGIDLQGEQAPFAVVSSGGVMGVGANLYKVPLNRLIAAPDADYFTMDITEKNLKSEFSKFEPMDERNENK